MYIESFRTFEVVQQLDVDRVVSLANLVITGNSNLREILRNYALSLFVYRRSVFGSSNIYGESEHLPIDPRTRIPSRANV